MIKSRKGLSGVQGGKGICYQGKEKGQCFQGDCCSFRHETQDRAQKPEHTAATPSEPTVSRGRSVSRKRSIRGKCNHGSILRQPCRYFVKGTCTRTSCEYWHPPECQFYKNETGCKAGDKCLFPRYKVDEQPNKKPKKEQHPKKKRKRRQECCGYCEKCITIGLMHSFLPMQKVLEPIQWARFTKSTLRHASIREKKAPSLGKHKCQSSSSAKSVRYEI